MPKWFDLGQEGVMLRYVVIKESKKSNLVIIGLNKDSDEWHRCVEDPDLRFKPAPTGKPILYRPFVASEMLMLPQIQKAFPSARLINIANAADVRLQLDGGARVSAQELAFAAAMKHAAFLGTNAKGQRVFENTDDSRFILDVEGKRIEENVLPPALVLRGTPDNIRLCAQGFVAGLMAGGHAEASDVGRFAQVLYGAAVASNRSVVERLSQAIEAAMAEHVRIKHEFAGDAAYREAQSLYENSPPHMGMEKGPGAVPLPVAVAAQELIRAFGGEDNSDVYVPRLFDGTLVAMLGEGYSVLTEDVDAGSREAMMRHLVPEHVNYRLRMKEQHLDHHPISVLNEDDVSEGTLNKLRSEIDHRYASGLTVLMIPEYTDENLKQSQRLATNDFMMSLQRDYAVMGLGIISTVMRKKMGIMVPMMMAVVGHRFNSREKAIREGKWLPIAATTMYDWDALRTFSNNMLVSVHEAAGRKMSAAEEAALRANEAIENSYQLPYQSFSTNGEVELMIPRNLAGSTYKALQRLEDRVGDLDTYVRNAINFDAEQYKYLAPEQVDAAALMVASIDRGRGFILGDQTGAGKGVTLATAVSVAWERGFPVIFVTKQDNLFSDFYRDLKKTGLHAKMRPLVLNHGAAIVDQFSDTLEKVASGISRKEFMANFRFGLSGFDNPNIIFATYSQFNAGEESEKSDWIKSVAPNAVVIFDEAHIAAGDTSKLGTVCTDMADLSRAVVFSSATWLKDARQMRFYQRALPASVDANMVSDAMKAGGESLQEVFTAMMAEDGLFIRRERDSSAVDIIKVTDDTRLAANEQIANKVSVILQGLQRLCGVTDQVGRRLTKGQVDKLDTAQRYIRSALDRLVNETAAQTQRLARDQDAAALGRSSTEEESEELLAAQEAAAALLANAPGDDHQVDLAEAQAQADNQAQMIELAAAENEDFIANGEGQRIFSGPDVDETDPMRMIEEMRIEDIGLSDEMTAQIQADLQSAVDSAEAKGRLEKEIRRIKRMIRGVSTKTTSFGSMLFLTQRTLNISLQARFAAERAIEKIREGKKPIIFLEQTFEKRLAEEMEGPNVIQNEDGTVTIKPITLKDNLREMYNSIVNIAHVDAEGNRTSGTIMDERFMASESERAAVVEGLKTLDDLIDELPDDLHCSPIDTICNAIRDAGFTVGEATGRKYQVVEMGAAGWKVALRKKKEAKLSEIERNFNFGEYDALVGNKALSTGMSLHASKDFPDQRQRSVAFTQVFSDINDYIQAMGRADRRGQIMSPEVEMLASGLPSEARVMMNHHDKLRRLLASTTSNRSSKFEEQELPDLFNSVGDASVRDFLQANPGIATRLGIEFAYFMPSIVKANGQEDDVLPRGLAKHVVARLDLLPVAESRSVYLEIAHNFSEVVKELEQQGVNPLRTNVIDLRDSNARVDKREDLLPALLDEKGELASVFDEAVELHTVVIDHHIAATSWEDTLNEIELNSNRMLRESARARQAGDRPDFVADLAVPAIHSSSIQHGPMVTAVKLLPSGLRERASKMFDAMKVMMTSSNSARRTAGSVAENEGGIQVMVANGQGVIQVSPAQVLQRRRTWLLGNLQYMMPGQYVSISISRFGMGNYKSFKGVVTSLQVPPKGRETNLSRWSITVQSPGYSESLRFTFQDLYRNKFVGLDQWLPGQEEVNNGLLPRPVAEEFNDFTAVDRTQKRYVLRGNLFRAASIAAENRIGAGGVLQLRDEVPTRVISIRKDMTKGDIYESVPVELSRDESARLFCNTWESLNRPTQSAKYWADFMRKSLETRGIHSHKDPKLTSISIYWLPTRSTYSQGVEEGMSEEEIRSGRNEASGDENLIAGIGVRVRRSVVSQTSLDTFVAEVNASIGYEAVNIMKGRSADSVRCVVRFKNEDGERDAPEVIRTKLATVVAKAGHIFNVTRYYTHSAEMRVLSMAVTSQNREQMRAMRDAADEERSVQSHLARLALAQDELEDDDMDDGEDGDQEQGA
jgi:hypothetical protein